MTKEQKSIYNKRFYQKNRERCIATTKEYQKLNKEKVRAYQRVYYRVRCYGIDKNTFDRMLKYQNNRCGICGITFNLADKKSSPHVDHNHSTGKLRQFLCMKCNCGIGSFNDNPTLLKKAVEYLESFK